jgi:hypothetical protein
MSPKTGRPVVGSEPKDKQINLRATQSMIDKFTECAKSAGKTKTDLLEEMISDYHRRLCKKKTYELLVAWRRQQHIGLNPS